MEGGKPLSVSQQQKEAISHVLFVYRGHKIYCHLFSVLGLRAAVSLTELLCRREENAEVILKDPDYLASLWVFARNIFLLTSSLKSPDLCS